LLVGIEIGRPDERAFGLAQEITPGFSSDPKEQGNTKRRTELDPLAETECLVLPGRTKKLGSESR
jgi:hypothetical protein